MFVRVGNCVGMDIGKFIMNKIKCTECNGIGIRPDLRYSLNNRFEKMRFYVTCISNDMKLYFKVIG